MTVNFRNAIRSPKQVLLGLAGPTGTGKTYSALLIAHGMQEIAGGEIFCVDTENGRMLHYDDEFEFKHYAEMAAPFSPARYLEHIEDAQKAGAKIVIVDSASHMHEGVGGVLDMHERELERMAGSDFAKRERVKFAAWIKPKAEFNRFVNTLLQVGVHAIFCFRAKDKLVLVKNAQGKNEPVSAGWTPIITERMDYEMTATLVLPPGAKGVPDLQAKAQKLPQPLVGLFKEGRALSRDTGRALAEWAREGKAGVEGERAVSPTPPPSASGPSVISPEQRDELIALADEIGVDKPAFCKFYGVPSLADIPADAFDKAKSAMLKKRAKASA